MVRWFSNHKQSSAKPSVTPLPNSFKPPRAKNWKQLVAEDHAETLKSEMAAKRRASGSTPKESSLADYHALKNNLIENLDAETRNAYEAKAAAFNTKLKAPPEPSIIYEYACLHIIFP